MHPSHSRPLSVVRLLPSASRRRFLASSARLAGAAGLSGTLLSGRPVPHVHAADSGEVRVALIGCGGRGGGAAADALSVPGAPVKVVALADVFRDRAEIVKRSLGEQFKERVDVPDERIFVGFDAYKRAVDCLRPGDIALCATPPAFRAPHFAYCIEKGVNVFMEKPVSIDGPSTRRIIELAAKASEKNLKVGVGLMCRHCDRRRELLERLRAGEAGELHTFYGYREHNPPHNLDLYPGPQGMNELLWQIKRFHNFLWASGGIFSDYCVHHVDEVCWMKGAWPVRAEAIGARQLRGKIDDQNFDNYGIEYTFEDGAKFFYSCQVMKDCDNKFGVWGQGTKGAFAISTKGHSPAHCAIYKDQRIDKDNVLWAAAQPEPNPYRREWEHLVAAVLADEPYNEAVRGAEASLATAMGRFAAHTGRPVTYDEMMACPDDLTAGVDALTDGSPAPVQADAEGRYPVPMPGKYKYEYRS
ncbi:MAG: Gfo/Idh/MocA family protein [Planctomycetia bacterium]